MLHPTNPDYKKLAYRRALLTEVMAQLKRNYMPDDTGRPPPKTLRCEHLFGGDAEVPPEAVSDLFGELYKQATDVAVEMTNYNFTRTNTSEPKQAEPKEPKNERVASPKAAKPRGKKPRGDQS
jgi:hypothetical protein